MKLNQSESSFYPQQIYLSKPEITPLVIPFLVPELTYIDSGICQRADLKIESKQMNWSAKTNEHDKNAVADYYFRE